MIRIPKILPPVQQFSQLARLNNTSLLKPQICISPIQNTALAQQTDVVAQPLLTQTRSVIKFSLKKGKRKSVKTVLKRFYRLHWGGWIRTIAGKNKRVWLKSPANRLRVKHHVICNSTQSHMLDKMVTKFWRKPKFYVNDIYEPYHTRNEFHITRKLPRDRDSEY